MANTHKQRNFCEICLKTINGNSYKFKAHLFRHNAVKARHKCEFCSKQFFRSDTYGKHMQTHMGIVTVKKYICDYCDRSFTNKYNLIIHLRRIHDDGLNTELGKFDCGVCDINYCERRLLLNHIRKVHFTNDHTAPSHADRLINESWIEKVANKNTCVLMTKVNNNVIVIKNVKINNDKVNDANVKTSSSTATATDQYSKAICDYCRKEMIKKSLRLHIRERHMNLRKHICMTCKVTFKRHYQLVDHKCGKVRLRKSKGSKKYA